MKNGNMNRKKTVVVSFKISSLIYMKKIRKQSKGTKPTFRPCHSSSGQSLAFHLGGPGSSSSPVIWDLRQAKCHWGRFSSRTSVFPANLHSTNCSIITIIWGRYSRPIVAAVPSTLSLTPLRIIITKKPTFGQPPSQN
jgi:hypothetical protein